MLTFFILFEEPAILPSGLVPISPSLFSLEVDNGTFIISLFLMLIVLFNFAEPPIPAPHCPRLYGIFSDEAKCDVFWNCWNGEASRYQCSPGLAYDREARVCMWADQVPECKNEGKASHCCQVLRGVMTEFGPKIIFILSIKKYFCLSV